MTAIRLLGATSGTGVLAAFAYDDLGRRTALNRGNGTSTTYAYDPVSRLTSLTQDLAGTVRDLTVTLGSYNPAGQIGSRSRSNDAYAWTQAYNVNRNYTANGLNQLTLSGAATLGYDTRGNLTSDGTATFAYDTENRMTGIVAGGYGNFAYDPLGRLVGTCCGLTGDTTWGYDGDHLAIKTATSSGGPLERYVFGPNGDEPLVLFYGGDTSTPRWLHADERGSIVATSDASGTVLATNAYDDYGIPQNPMGGGNAIGPFGYTGQMWVPEAGVYNYKARFYSPTLGRFMQTDPIGYGDGNNWYNYVKSDPVNASDPNGLCAKALSGCGGGDPYWGNVIGTQGSGSRIATETYSGLGGQYVNWYIMGYKNQDGKIVPTSAPYTKPVSQPFGLGNLGNVDLNGDGSLSRDEADAHYRSGTATPVKIDASKFIVKLEGPAPRVGGSVIGSVYGTSDWFTFGRVSLLRTGSTSYTIRTELYDFDVKPEISFRNVETILGSIRAGSGVGFETQFQGNPRVIPQGCFLGKAGMSC